MAAAPKKLLNHHGENCKKTATANIATKTKKSTSRNRAVGGKSNANELLSSPSTKSRAECAAHRGALLNPTDVDDPALSAVNSSVCKINYDIVSPGGAACAQANGIGETVGTGMDFKDDDEDYRGDVYEDDYSLVKSHYQSIVSLLHGARVLAVSLRLDNPQNQTQKGCVNVS